MEQSNPRQKLQQRRGRVESSPEPRNVMSVKVQVVKSVLSPMGHDEALNRIAVVYMDGEEYRVSAPAKASGPAIEWLDHAFVRQPDTNNFGSELEVSGSRAVLILKYVKEALENYRTPIQPAQASSASGANESAAQTEPIALLCFRFHEVVKQLRTRHANRPTVDIQDEYDVQDVMHALLRIFFEDVRDEEWTPSYAGGAARMDFLIPEVETVLEVKKTRNGLGLKEVGEQLLIDIAKYQKHPKCKRLICLVYDPEGRISNARGLEKDLRGKHGELDVDVLVVPR
jgi:hypothetical protein